MCSLVVWDVRWDFLAGSALRVLTGIRTDAGETSVTFGSCLQIRILFTQSFFIVEKLRSLRGN